MQVEQQTLKTILIQAFRMYLFISIMYTVTLKIIGTIKENQGKGYCKKKNDSLIN